MTNIVKDRFVDPQSTIDALCAQLSEKDQRIATLETTLRACERIMPDDEELAALHACVNECFPGEQKGYAGEWLKRVLGKLNDRG